MSPEAKAAASTIAVLRQELAADRAALDRHHQDATEVLGRWPEAAANRYLLTFAAVAAHAWYTALEALLERVARALDGVLPTGPRSHLDLLELMTVEVPGLRPAILPPGVTRKADRPPSLRARIQPRADPALT